MGMYDSVKIKIKCPYCGEESEIEAQTKELDCTLEVWKVGDFVSDKFNYLDCVADCLQPECKKASMLGYHSRIGRFFNVRIFLKKGKVSGKYKITKDEYF